MAFPGTKLDVIVEIALSPDLTLLPSSWVWTDVTDWVLVKSLIRITRGRGDYYSTSPPATCRLTVNNTDGRWCRTNPLGAWHGQLTKNTPLRVRVNGGSGYVHRFLGFIDELPSRWIKRGTYSYAPITASGVLRRVAQGETLRSGLFRAHMDGYFSTGQAVGYWSMEDASGATSFASALGHRPMTFADMSLSADSDVAGSDPLPLTGGAATISGTVPTYTSTGTWAIRWVMNVPASPSTTTGLMSWNTSGTVARWVLELVPGSPDLLKLRAYNSSGTELLADTGAPFEDDGVELYGRQLYFEINGVQNGANIDWEYNVWYGSSGSGKLGSVAGTIGTVSTVYHSAYPGLTGGGVTIGHVAVGNDTGFGAASYGSTGFSGETTYQRLVRLAAEENLNWAYLNNLPETAMGAQSTSSLIAQFREVEAAEGGPLFDSTEGDIMLSARQDRYNATVALSLDFDAGQVAEPPEPTDDDQQLRNDITVSRVDGSSARKTLTTGAVGTLTAGVYSTSQTLNVETDNVLPTRASWLLHLGTVEDVRWPRISLNLARATSKIPDWLDCDVSSRIQLTNPPSQLAPDDIDLILEGYTETLGPHTWTADLNTSPGQPWSVYQVEDDNLGRVDTSGSELLLGVTSSATSWLVASTEPAGLPSTVQWSTTAEPYSWHVAGERVTVTTMNTNPVAFVAVGTAAHGNNASVVPGMPGGTTTAGDLLLVFAAIRNSGTGTVNQPTGYETLLSFGNMALFGKIHSGTESAPTVSFTGGVANADTSAQMASFRYAQLSVLTSATQLNGSAQDIAWPALTSVDRGRRLILYLGWKQDDWTSVTGGLTLEIGEPDTTTGDDQGLVWSYSIQTVPVDISASSFTVTGGAAAISRSAVVALAGDVQSCTVTRAVNGVSKAQATGADISLWRPGVGGISL